MTVYLYTVGYRLPDPRDTQSSHEVKGSDGAICLIQTGGLSAVNKVQNRDLGKQQQTLLAGL